MSSKKQKKLAVIDFETDPFKWGRVPKPFAGAFFDGEQYMEFWGEDCAHLLIEYINSLEDEYLIYAHNGGKFDFFFLLEQGAIENPVKIINGRIVACKMGKHELRDSYAILPIPLAAYQKDEIDYNNFEANVRNKYRSEILHYLAKDCEYLYELVSKFVSRFGTRLTIGGTAIKELEKLHPFKRQRHDHDEMFRPYYYGGRVQCFKHGIHEGKFKVYDVNSMYPYVMKHLKHPIGNVYITTRNCRPSDIMPNGNFVKYPNKPYFIHFEGTNKGALPVRTKTGLSFEQESGEFFACSHEIKVAIKYGLIKIDKIHSIKSAFNTISFDTYVDTYMVEKIEGKQEKNKTKEIFAKLLLNSASGKFGQNPDNYHEYFIRYIGDDLPGADFDLYLDYGGIEIWRKPSPSHNYFDVAVAASVTSASRAVLLEALQKAVNPIYCDTDSIICDSLEGVPLHDSDLGAWKFEGEGNRIAIAGKKLYALKNGNDVIKLASKGVRISADAVFNIAGGGEYHYRHDAPNFKLSGNVNFTDRRVRATK